MPRKLSRQQQRSMRMVKRRALRQKRAVAPKLVELNLLKRVLNGKEAKLLPYHVVHKPQHFSLNAFHPLPARILVRSDLALERGMRRDQWASLPRHLFVVNPKNLAETKQKIRRFIFASLVNEENYVARGRLQKMFFVMHSL